MAGKGFPEDWREYTLIDRSSRGRPRFIGVHVWDITVIQPTKQTKERKAGQTIAFKTTSAECAWFGPQNSMGVAHPLARPVEPEVKRMLASSPLVG